MGPLPGEQMWGDGGQEERGGVRLDKSCLHWEDTLLLVAVGVEVAGCEFRAKISRSKCRVSSQSVIQYYKLLDYIEEAVNSIYYAVC